MKNKYERMKEAQAFAKENSAYIHVECKNGKHEGTVMSGDPVAIMTGILFVLCRLSEISGMPVDIHIEMLGEMQAMSSDSGKEKKLS